MSKYLWFLIALGLIGLVFFGNALVANKTNLAAVITLQPLEKPAFIKQGNRETLIARIYSTYPFNHRNFLTVNAGFADGVALGMAVSTDGNFLLGQVTEVFEYTSNIRTIFDKNWTISVRLGTKATDALLVSGQDPQLTLIDKKAKAEEGAPVYSASRAFP
jgi:cell shape-determining protein MreC